MALSAERMEIIANIANDEWVHDLPLHNFDAENDKEFATQEPVWQEIREEFLASSDSAEELHEFVKLHHWGEADDFLILIENPACDRNTARLIFWLSGPEFFRRKFSTSEDAKSEDQKKSLLPRKRGTSVLRLATGRSLCVRPYFC